MDIIKVGRNIAKIRRQNNLTQEKVAEVLQISAAAVSKWENGHTLPDITLLPELAKIFDCTIDHILLAERERKESSEMTNKTDQKRTTNVDPNFALADQIIKLIEGKNMIGMNDQTIMNAFSAKHGHLGDVRVVRNRSTRSENYIMNSITVEVNRRKYYLLEKMLFGNMTELYQMKLISESGISVPLIYKIDLEEKSILIEDLSEDYISGRECDEESQAGEIYRQSYSDIMEAVARFHLSFWDKQDMFEQIGLPWHLQNESNFISHIEGVRHDLATFVI